MNRNAQRPKTIWSKESLPPSVDAYFDAYFGEFDIYRVASNYPYSGKSSAAFRRIVKMDEYEASERFEGKGNGCWALKRDALLNDLTADLFAAADALGGKLETESSSAFPGGIGADSGTVWVDLLDGGVGVEVLSWQHEYTNHMHARQRTTIRGPMAYRALLELLGFDWINRKLYGEVVRPDQMEIIRLVDDIYRRNG